MFKTCSKVKSTESQSNLNSDIDKKLLANISDEKLGFIMMECGFEGISFKVCICKINIVLKLFVITILIFVILGCKKIKF